jgi:hypothetical protein
MSSDGQLLAGGTVSVNEYRSVEEALTALADRGYTANFEYLKQGFTQVETGRTFTPTDLTIVEHHRFEGASDPDDESIVYAIECGDGTRGVLVDAFGPYANPALGEFLRDVRMTPAD